MSLKSIIENFLAYVEELETKLRSGEDFYEKEFQELKVLTDQVRATPQFVCSAGEQSENRRKNRYKDILPYDFNRVILHDDPEVPGSDYINASYIKGASGSIAYIAAQAPLPNTVGDFWRMAWESEVQTIVMVCNEIEAGRAKCERYWSNENEVRQFGKIMVKLVEKQDVGVDYKVRELSITYGDMTRKINHFHYHTWPDHGVPLSVKAMIDMVGLVRRFQVSETVPILVHCSAGCGRTGTVCAIDYICGLLRIGKLTDDFSIKQLVFEMRKQRIAMVQTSEQYMVVHRAVRELFEEHLKVIDSHPYANIDFTGQPYLHTVEGDYENIEPRGVIVVESGGPVVITVSKEETCNKSDTKVPPLPKKTKSDVHKKADCDLLPRNSFDCLETNTDKVSNRSRMDYVKDWCDGILTSKSDASVESQQDLSEESILQQQQFRSARLSTPAQSPSQSPSSKRGLTSEINSDKLHGGKSNFSNLVRKPSMAKFRALFDNGSNSGSSGTSSPENWRSRSSPRLSVLPPTKPQADAAATSEESRSLSVRKPVRSKSKAKEGDFQKDKSYVKIMTRYDDAAYRIFKENRNLLDDNVDGQDYQMVGSTPSPSSRSGNGCDNHDDFSLSDSPSPKIYRHRSYLSVSHSPLPTSSSESVVKDLVTRVVGSRRNSYAERRSSTWYDDAASIEADCCDKTSDSPQGSGYKNVNASHLSGHRGSNRKFKNNNGSVKRSISMKVGFRSPMFSRKKNMKGNVAAYLAVEDAKKNEGCLAEDQPKPMVDNIVDNRKILNKELETTLSSKNSSCDNLNEKEVLRHAIAKDLVSKTVPVPSPRLSRVHIKDSLPLSIAENKHHNAEFIKNLEATNSEPREVKSKKNDMHPAKSANENVGSGESSVMIKELLQKSKMDDEPTVVYREGSPKAEFTFHNNSSADDSYGAEMDEYCQRIIRDCQKYLVSRQSIYLPSELKDGDENSGSSNTIPPSSQSKFDGRKSGHDYERLWFSRTATKDIKEHTNISDDHNGHSSVRNIAATHCANDDSDQMYVNHPFKSDDLRHHFEVKLWDRDCNSEEEMLKKSIEDLRLTIEQLGTGVVIEKSNRKPLPAPRTTLHCARYSALDENHDVVTKTSSSARRTRNDESSSHSCSNSTIHDLSKIQNVAHSSCSSLDRRNFHDYENTVLMSDSSRLHGDLCRSVIEDGYGDFMVGDRVDQPAEGSDHSSSTALYRSVHKCRSRDGASHNRQNKHYCGDDVRINKTDRNHEEDELMSKSMMNMTVSVKPVAPPRLRRKPSVSSPRNFEAPTEHRPTSLEIEKHCIPCDRQHTSLHEHNIGSSIENVDETPPVPVKTKDAYRLPQDESLVFDLTSLESQSTTSGLNLSKALNKLQTNILAKFAHNSIEKESDPSSSVGDPPRRASQRCLVVPGFPDRLDIKPKGPREPPHHWKVSSCTL